MTCWIDLTPEKAGSRKPDTLDTTVQIVAVSLTASNKGFGTSLRIRGFLLLKQHACEESRQSRLFKDTVDCWLVCLNLLSGISCITFVSFGLKVRQRLSSGF